MDWNDLKFFITVAQTRSLSAASRRLGVSISTVSRRITALEQSLGVVLFRHHHDGYELTESGVNLLRPAEQATANLSVFERTAKDLSGELSGVVRIDVPELLGQHILVPNLDVFMNSYPDIQLDIHSSVQPVELSTQKSDIVVRLVRPEKGNYKIKKAGEIKFGFYAHNEYLACKGKPYSIAEMHGHKFIDWGLDFDFLTMSLWLDEVYADRAPWLRLNSFTSQLIAAEKGLGIAVLPCFAANQAGLIPLLEDIPPLNMDLWLLVHEKLDNTPRVKIVKNILASLLSREI